MKIGRALLAVVAPGVAMPAASWAGEAAVQSRDGDVTPQRALDQVAPSVRKVMLAHEADLRETMVLIYARYFTGPEIRRPMPGRTC